MYITVCDGFSRIGLAFTALLHTSWSSRVCKPAFCRTLLRIQKNVCPPLDANDSVPQRQATAAATSAVASANAVRVAKASEVEGGALQLLVVHKVFQTYPAVFPAAMFIAHWAGAVTPPPPAIAA